MNFAVLVATFRRPEHLRRNLEALALQSRKPDEILIALRPAEDPEGVSTANDFQAAHPELDVRKVEVSVPGVIAAENAMLDACSAEVACFLDDDAIARPFWLERLSRHYGSEKRIGGVAGPAIDVIDGKPRERRARFRNRIIFPGIVLDQSTRHTDRPLRVDHFRGANMSFRTAALRACGGFDQNLRGDGFRFEMDACLGVSAQGYRLVFEPGAEVDHHEAPRPTNQHRYKPETIRINAANETCVLLKHWGLGIKGGIHMLFAVLVGNFPCPGLAWALVAQVLGPITGNRHLLGLRYLLPAIHGRFDGLQMARRRRSR